MHRRLLGEDALDHLAARARAGQYGFVDLGLHDPRQFAQMPERCVEPGGVIGIWCVRNQLANTRHHSAHLRKTVDGLVRPFRQVDDVLAIEQAFNEPIQFLEANEAILAQVDGGRLCRRAGQPEGLTALLMPGEVVPKPLHQSIEQFVDLLDAVKGRQFATPKVLDDLKRRGRNRGRCDIAQEAGAYLVERHGALMLRQQCLGRLNARPLGRLLHIVPPATKIIIVMP